MPLSTSTSLSSFQEHGNLPMITFNPRTTLVLLLAMAAVVFAGGLRLARREESVRIDRDREAVRHFTGELQVELQRLEDLYDTHLARLARNVPANDAFEIRRAADGLIGIRQFSLVHRDRARDLHVQVTPVPGARTPVPMFEAPRAGLAGVPVLVPAEKLLHFDTGSGWIDEPGKPLMFWLQRSSTEAAVLLIDVAAVEAAINRYLAAWAATPFERVRAARGLDHLRGSSGHALFSVGPAPAGTPDVLLPLRSRFGRWELASWDARETRVKYDTAALATASVLSLLLGCLGAFVFIQQRTALRMAAQRVSFVNRVSHELRTPLTNILLNVDLALETAGVASSEAARRLALVHEEAQRLGRLIENVLTFSSREQGKLRIEPRACVPANVVGAVVEQFVPSFVRRGLVVKRAGEATAACLLNPDALAQILANLLSNVEKYVPGGVVEIKSAHDGKSLVIDVTDEGPGIPAHETDRVFRPFERLDSRVNEGATGTGLGLAIARDLAARMGGSLHLAPSARGASFQLRVPAPLVPRPELLGGGCEASALSA